MPIDVAIDLETILKKDINLLTMDELKLRLKEMEKKGAIQALVGKDDLKGIGPNDEVFITIPSGPSSDVYMINEKQFPPGKYKMKLRTARQLSSMVAESWKIEKERLISRGNHMNGALLRGEELSKIERFQQIMAED